MKTIFISTILFLLTIPFCYTQSSNDLNLGKIIVSVNVGNAVVLRPQLSVEYRLSNWNSIELTGGYISQNKWLQNKTVKFLNEDAFLAKGLHLGVGFKRMSAINKNSYYGVQTYFKKHSYQNEIWHNGPKEGLIGSMSYVVSNNKTQAGAYVVIGSYKPIGSRLFLNVFGGFGMLYYQYKKVFHRQIYDYSLRYINTTAPFTEIKSKMYPIVHFGIKLGLRGIK